MTDPIPPMEDERMHGTPTRLTRRELALIAVGVPALVLIFGLALLGLLTRFA